MRRIFLRTYGSGFDADYQAVLDYANSQGYTLPSASQQIIQNQLVLDLKSNGLWQKFDLFYLTANDAGLEFSLINWINPNSHYLIESSSGVWSWVTNSHIKRGNNSVNLNTNWTPSINAINWKLNDASFGWKTLSTPVGVGTDDGVIRLGNNGLTQTNNAIWLYDANYNCRVWINKSGTASNFGNAYRFISNGNKLISVGLLSNTAYLFSNGVQQTTKALVPTGLDNTKVYFMVNGFDYYMQMWYLGGFLNTTDNSNLNILINNYLTAI